MSIDLKLFLEQSTFVEEELEKIRKDFEADVNYSQGSISSVTEYILRASNLRQAYRSLAEGIQANRSLVQIQKQKIQNKKVFLQGLNSYKKTLIDKIKQCQIDVLDVKDYVDSPLEIENWIEEFEDKERRLTGSLQASRDKQKMFEELVEEKSKKEIMIREKKELYQKILPQQANRILEQVQETSKFFNVAQFEQFQGIKHQGLSLLYDRLNPLRSSKVLEIKYNNDQFEELEIVICKNNHKYYKQAFMNRLPIQQQQIKLSFVALSPTSKMVLGLDRRQDYSNQQIFQRLINDQTIKLIYPSPMSQLQRNINSKYIRLDWIDSLLLTGIISPQNFVQQIKQRYFSLRLTAYLMENMKKLSFYFPLNSQNQLPSSGNFKKNSTGSLQKITFNEYRKLMHTPDWIQKYASQLSGNKTMIDQNEDLSKGYLLNLLATLKLEEQINTNMNTYYKGFLNLNQLNFEFLLIIPINYPKGKSLIHLVSYQKKREEDRRIPTGLPCKFQVKGETKNCPDRLLFIQRSVNEEISQFFKTQEEQNPFRILLQLNRLLTLLAQQIDKKL